MKTLIALGALAMVAASHADATIDTLSGWNGTDYIHPFGVGDTSTYGQTFVTPNTAPLLMTWEFQLRSEQTDNSFHGFNFYVMAWDDVNGHATGSVLYKSGDLFLADTGTWQDFVVAPNVMLTAGGKYVGFMSTSEADRNTTWGADQAARYTDAYSAGLFAYENNGADTSQWTNTTWNQIGDFDSSFKAVFCGTVPEPMSMTGLGIAALALIRRKRNSK